MFNRSEAFGKWLGSVEDTNLYKVWQQIKLKSTSPPLEPRSAMNSNEENSIKSGMTSILDTDDEEPFAGFDDSNTNGKLKTVLIKLTAKIKF